MLVLHAASSPLTLRLFIDNLRRGFAEAGFRFLYLSGGNRGGQQPPGETVRVTLPRGYLFPLAWFSSGVTLRKVLAVKPDVFHVHTPATALGLVWVLKGLKKNNVRLVYTARGGFDEGRRWVTRALWHAVDPLRWGVWDAIGVVNQHLLESTRKVSQKPHVALLSLGGASLNLADSTLLSRREAPASESPTVRLAWVGRFSRDKRPVDFIRLLAFLRNEHGLAVEGIMMGDGDGIDRARVNTRQHPDIRKLGWIDCPQVFLQDCDLLISTSAREGYGLAPVESALVGTPTIAYTTFGTLKSVAEVGGRLVPKRDLTALAHEVLDWVGLSRSAKTKWRTDVEKKSRELVKGANLVDEISSLYGRRS